MTADDTALDETAVDEVDTEGHDDVQGGTDEADGPETEESPPEGGAEEAPGPQPATADEVTMYVWRGDSDGGEFEKYVLPAQEGEVVLDVIHRVQATEAPDLACRWNCKAGKCGSCSAEINGMPSLLCMTRMDALPAGEPVVVAPMKTFPILRDLVTDVSYNYEVAKRIPPFAPRPKTADEEEAGGYRMQQIDVERSQEFRKCIECYLCQNVCHVIRDHEENKTAFAGPRFFARSAELEMHPLDTNDRRELLQKEQGLGKCNITKCCTEVCPEHIKITDNAIIPLKERVVDASYDPVAWLGRKLLGRKKRSAAEASATSPAQGPAAVQPATAVRGIPEAGGEDLELDIDLDDEVDGDGDVDGDVDGDGDVDVDGDVDGEVDVDVDGAESGEPDAVGRDGGGVEAAAGDGTEAGAGDAAGADAREDAGDGAGEDAADGGGRASPSSDD